MILDTSEWFTGIVEEHFEELNALWLCRLNSIDSPNCLEADLRKLDVRIASHADALVLSTEHALGMFEENLQGEREQVFSACFPLAYVNTSKTRKLIFSKLESSKSFALDGFADAFCHASSFLSWADAHKLVESASDPVAGVLTHAMAFHGLIRSEGNVVRRLLDSDKIDEKIRGWTILSLLQQSDLIPERVESAWSDKDPRVGIAATRAAIWTKQPWLAAYCGEQCRGQSIYKRWAAKVLGILGRSSDLAVIKSLLEDESLGIERLQLATSFGHPSVIPLLCEYMGSKDQKTAIAATSEFMRMTGMDVESETLVKVNGSEAGSSDEFEDAFAEEAFLPDIDKAKRIWRDREKEWSSYSFLHRGVEIAREKTVVGNESIDLLAQLELAMRARYLGFESSSYASSNVSIRAPW